MENASKALLIAAAIIIAVVLISLGVMVLSNGSNLVKDNSDMSEVEITGFNNKFEQYFGTNVRGANVNALVNAVNTNNSANAEDDSKIIEIEDKSSTATGIVSSDSSKNKQYERKAKTGKTYTVECKAGTEGHTSGGLVHKITITEH